MSDLISRAALLDAMPKNDELLSLDVRRVICDAPAVDAVPVVHAKWEIIHGMINPKYQDRKRCSCCGDISPSDMCCREMLTDYCPNCGAKMEVTDNNVGNKIGGASDA